jgi:hypothetical protein
LARPVGPTPSAFAGCCYGTATAFADRCGRSGGQSSRRAARRACGRFADPDLSERNVVKTSERCRRRGWPWHHSRSSARRRVRCDRRRRRTGGPPFMPHPKASRSSCSIAARLADRLALPQGSRITWAFRRAFPAKRLQRAPLFRPRNSERNSRSPSRSSSSTAHARRCTASRSTEAYRSMDGRW